MYCLRTNNAGTWANALVADATEIAENVAPVFRENMNTKIYLFDLPTSKAAPTALAVTRMYNPEDDNDIMWLVQTISGLTLFEFDFPLVVE